MTDENEPHKRRVRYRGTHPRRFQEKYKELDPVKYPQEQEKVLARRQTPAGTHVPICVKEILDTLHPEPGDVGLDATLGFGGHTMELLAKIVPGGKLFCIDVDPLELPHTEARIREAGYTEDVCNIRRLNFAGIMKLQPEIGEGFNFILADLGVSSMQIDNPERGFTFKAEGPLDLRLNPTRGISAAELIRRSSVKQLSTMLTENADEPFAEQVALLLFERRDRICTSIDLRRAVQDALQHADPPLPPSKVKKTVQRTFQALRIAVNDEFGVLDQFLRGIPWCLAPGGRVAILTFHSGEDRRVLGAFEEGLARGVYSAISPAAVRPSTEEQIRNPRSNCARLRWAVASRERMKNE